MTDYFTSFPDLTDAEIRALMRYADEKGYPQRGRELILPPRKVLIGEVYGMEVFRGPVVGQEPYMSCELDPRRVHIGRSEIRDHYANSFYPGTGPK